MDSRVMLLSLTSLLYAPHYSTTYSRIDTITLHLIARITIHHQLFKMKRKASDLEESSAYLDWTTDYSSNASTASPESVKAPSDHSHSLSQTYARWNVGTVPYQSSRTRKRYRDGRPDEGTIHQNTLAKLFNAQRHIRQEEQNGSWRMDLSSEQQVSNNRFDESVSGWNETVISMEPPSQNQRSIDSFFGGGRAPRSIIQIQKPQSSSFRFSTIQETPSVESRCEDCNSPLHPTNEGTFMSDMDAMSMDVDSQTNDWSCASCSRRVCDICAVRGDHRICLECAVPGGG